MKDKLWRVAVMAAIVAIAWFGGTPEGLKPQVWQLFGIYLATIVGLVLKPFPVPITVLLGVATSSILLSNTKDVLAGYSNTALWLIFAAFALSVAFGKTGLGHRIAYHLVRLFGSTTLRLGYVTAFLDLILSPATPSNTARAAVLFIQSTYLSLKRLVHILVKLLKKQVLTSYRMVTLQQR